jgi:hypothetical protein
MIIRDAEGHPDMWTAPETGRHYGYGTCGDGSGLIGCGALGNHRAYWLRDESRYELFCGPRCRDGQ